MFNSYCFPITLLRTGINKLENIENLKKISQKIQSSCESLLIHVHLNVISS